MKRIVYALLGLIAGSEAALAADLPVYRPGLRVSGEVRISGSPEDRALLQAWEREFREMQPGVRLSLSLHGPESTLAGVYTGKADIAFMARELREPLERMAFEWVRQRKPFEIEVANGGLGNGRPSEQLAVYVHESNPVAQLTLIQLDAILGAEHKRGAANARRWGDLGVQGPLGERSIHVHGPEVDSIPALFIRRTVLLDSRKWNPGYHEYASMQAVLEALSSDPAGIAYGPANVARPPLKAVAIANGAGARALTRETITQRSYPLTRVVTMALDHEPGRPIVPAVREFLRYVLSRQGQEAIARDGTHIALGAEALQRQRERLGS